MNTINRPSCSRLPEGDNSLPYFRTPLYKTKSTEVGEGCGFPHTPFQETRANRATSWGWLRFEATPPNRCQIGTSVLPNQPFRTSVPYGKRSEGAEDAVPSIWQPDVGLDEHRVLIVAKHRSGRTADVHCHWNGSQVHFENENWRTP